MTPVAIVLAGGLGTRIRAVHPNVPKPMIPVGGKPFLEWQLLWLAQQGIREVVLSAGYRADTIVGHFAVPRVAGIATRCVIEEEQRGTAGAARFAAQGIAAAWSIVCNGDSLCPAELAPLMNDAVKSNADVILLVSEVSDARDYGTVTVDEDGDVTGFLEKGAAAGSGLVNAGVYCARTAWLQDLPKKFPLSFERDVFPRMPNGTLRAVRTATPFLDIGVPERLAMAEEFMKRWLHYNDSKGGGV